MEGIDVSRLSVAECLALAEQQDAEKVGAVEITLATKLKKALQGKGLPVPHPPAAAEELQEL